MSQILVLAKSNLDFVDGKLETTPKHFFKRLNMTFQFMERELAEQDENYVQIIPYIVATQNNKIFIYSRLKKGGESRLHSKLSIGLGGHIDTTDLPLDLSRTGTTLVESAAYRELFEELKIELTEKIIELIPKGTLIYDDSNPVGRVHLGVLYTSDLSNRSVSINEVDKIEGDFKSVDEIKQLYTENPERFETWSVIALKSLGIIC